MDFTIFSGRKLKIYTLAALGFFLVGCSSSGIKNIDSKLTNPTYVKEQLSQQDTVENELEVPAKSFKDNDSSAPLPSKQRHSLNNYGWETHSENDIVFKGVINKEVSSIDYQRFYLDDKYVDRINLTSELLFLYNRDNVTDKADHVFSTIVEYFGPLLKKQYIYIVGHTDSDGTAEYNIGLSARRAASIVKLFGDHSLPNEKISVIPAGMHMPISPNDTKENKSKNRRVEIYISPWQDMPLQLIREAICPDDACSYAILTILGVNRDFNLSSSVRVAGLPQTIMPMQRYAVERNLSKAQISRKTKEMPVVIRNAVIKPQIRKVRSF